MYYSYTHDALQTLEIQLDEIIYLIEDIIYKDSEMELKSNGRNNMEYIRRCLNTAKQLTNATMQTC